MVETRSIGELRMAVIEDEVESRKIEGYAVVFDVESVYMRQDNRCFYEIISRNAITQDLVDSCDVLMLFDHDMKRVLARSNKGEGSLHLTVDDYGLRFEFESPNTNLGDELLEYLKRGDINKCSFAFMIDKLDEEAQTWERRDGKLYRTINKIAYIGDTSVVWHPAYQDTEISKRALDKVEEINTIEGELDALMLEIEELSKI